VLCVCLFGVVVDVLCVCLFGVVVDVLCVCLFGVVVDVLCVWCGSSSMPSNHKGFEHADPVCSSMDETVQQLLHMAKAIGLKPNDMRPLVSRAWSRVVPKGSAMHMHHRR